MLLPLVFREILDHISFSIKNLNFEITFWVTNKSFIIIHSQNQVMYNC